VSQSRLKPVVELGKMLKRHWDNLLTWLERRYPPEYCVFNGKPLCRHFM
jgi:hypothetical protein